MSAVNIDRTPVLAVSDLNTGFHAVIGQVGLCKTCEGPKDRAKSRDAFAISRYSPRSAVARLTRLGRMYAGAAHQIRTIVRTNTFANLPSRTRCARIGAALGEGVRCPIMG
jgi:hypothetical protein